MEQISPKEALRLAIERVGTARELAAKLNVTPQAISQWAEVPAVRVLSVERLSGVSRHLLRPDVYGPQAAEVAE